MFSGNQILIGLALILYATSLLFAVWRMVLGRPYRRWPKLGLLVPGFALHTMFLWERGLAGGRCPVSNLFEALTFIAWCLVALHLVIALVSRLHYLTVFYMPIVLVIQLAALIIPAGDNRFQNWQESSWLGLHAAVIILGYAAFALAGAVALMYLYQEQQLRTRRLGLSFMALPPILHLEVAQEWLIMMGFGLLTLGLASGLAGMWILNMSVSQTDAKLWWSLVVWMMYLVFVLGRRLLKMGGRSMAWCNLLGCLFVLGTFWLSNALSHFHKY